MRSTPLASKTTLGWPLSSKANNRQIYVSCNTKIPDQWLSSLSSYKASQSITKHKLNDGGLSKQAKTGSHLVQANNVSTHSRTSIIIGLIASTDRSRGEDVFIWRNRTAERGKEEGIVPIHEATCRSSQSDLRNGPSKHYRYSARHWRSILCWNVPPSHFGVFVRTMRRQLRARPHAALNHQADGYFPKVVSRQVSEESSAVFFVRTSLSSILDTVSKLSLQGLVLLNVSF